MTEDDVGGVWMPAHQSPLQSRQNQPLSTKASLKMSRQPTPEEVSLPPGILQALST
jgi:hypothetical protein